MLNAGSVVMDSLDYIMIVDKNLRIVYNTRYDEHFNDKSKEYLAADIMNQHYFDVYPTLDRAGSSIMRCIETEEVIVMKNQRYKDYTGREFVTNNVTVPLLRKGELVAVVELVMDVELFNEAIKESKEKKFDIFVQKVKSEAGLITFNTILTVNSEMRAAIDMAKALAVLPNPTLIYGETGTGKELFAQAMINYSQVPKSKVVVQNCAAVPETLIESTLFGTVRGAYTGAENKKGLFESADGGIIFLDELNSMPFHVQAKLLRVLQDGTFKPLGSNVDKRVNVKVIAAMNIDPVVAIEDNIIRKDLFYRFSSGLITLLPVRERKDDIAVYISHYINEFNQVYGKSALMLDPKLMDTFLAYPWEGNVREIKNTIESMIAAIPAGQEVVLTEEYVPNYLRNIFRQESAECLEHKEILEQIKAITGAYVDENGNIPYMEIMNRVEAELIKEALCLSHNNKSKASEILGMPRQTLKYKIEKLNL
ncbi:arginine utilization regulatory protein [Clostridiales Family XIII bacterium PM5-7]